MKTIIDIIETIFDYQNHRRKISFYVNNYHDFLCTRFYHIDKTYFMTKLKLRIRKLDLTVKYRFFEDISIIPQPFFSNPLGPLR